MTAIEVSFASLHQGICGIARWDAKIKLLRRGLHPALGRSPKGRQSMSQEREDQERPCLHRMIVELIDDFFAEHPATAGSDKVDTAEADEVIDAIAKTVAELTSQQNGLIRQQLIEQLIALRRRISP
jgi:hypothetical protein